jgi:hypothetical protein
MIVFQTCVRPLPEIEETSLKSVNYQILSSILKDQIKSGSLLSPQKLNQVIKWCLDMNRNKEL